LDRGFARVQTMRRFSAMIKTYPNGTYDRVFLPRDPVTHNIDPKFSVLEEDGICAVGERIDPGKVSFFFFIFLFLYLLIKIYLLYLYLNI